MHFLLSRDLFRFYPLEGCATHPLLSIDNEGLIAMLEDDFLYFTDRRYLQPYTNGFLLNTYYHLEFPYEGDWRVDPYEITMRKFQAKYEKRIDRFRNIANLGRKVFFMRSAYIYATDHKLAYQDPENLEISDDWSYKLYDVLKKRFPFLDFHLLIININDHREMVVRKLTEGITVIYADPRLEGSLIFSQFKEMFIKLLKDNGFSDSTALKSIEKN